MYRLTINTTLALLLALFSISCGDGKSESKKDRKQVITQKGSDTMILLAQAWSEAYAAKDPNVQIQVTGGGSGTGISALINGTTEIANSSRPMKEQEREQVKKKYGSEVVEIPVAKDGIAIYVHESNPLDSITVEQVRDIYNGTTKNWKELGGPDARIILYGRENSSGTYEFFKEHVLDKADFDASTQTLQGTAAVVNAVSKDPVGIGYGGEAYSKGVKALRLATKGGQAIAPSEQTIQSGDYPLARNLYFYLRQPPAGAIKPFIEWVLSSEGQGVVRKAGYFPLS